MVQAEYLELYLKPISCRNTFPEMNVNDMLKLSKQGILGYS